MPLDLPKSAETAAAIHIAGHFKKSWAYWGEIDNLYYWKSSSSGREVDFVIFLRDKPFGIEVKYQTLVSGWDELSIKKGIGNGIIITKNLFEYGTVCKIPLGAFLLTDLY
jgi:predicted AAA+ superfamily ATPase